MFELQLSVGTLAIPQHFGVEPCVLFTSTSVHVLVNSWVGAVASYLDSRTALSIRHLHVFDNRYVERDGPLLGQLYRCAL